MGITHMQLLLFFLLTVVSDAEMTYVTKTTYETDCKGAITSKSLWGVLDTCVQDARNGYSKSACNSTHLMKTSYLDKDCSINTNPPQIWTMVMECDTSDGTPTAYDCTGTGEPVVSTRYTTSGCADNSFDGVQYMIQDVCHKWNTASSEWYKRSCNSGKLEHKFFSDKACTTAATNATTTFELDQCQQTQLAGENKYLKLYKGCGQTGTLPTGVTDPDMGTTKMAQVSGTRRSQGALHFLVAMATAAALQAFC